MQPGISLLSSADLWPQFTCSHSHTHTHTYTHTRCAISPHLGFYNLRELCYANTQDHHAPTDTQLFVQCLMHTHTHADTHKVTHRQGERASEGQRHVGRVRTPSFLHYRGLLCVIEVHNFFIKHKYLQHHAQHIHVLSFVF